MVVNVLLQQLSVPVVVLPGAACGMVVGTVLCRLEVASLV